MLPSAGLSSKGDALPNGIKNMSCACPQPEMFPGSSNSSCLSICSGEFRDMSPCCATVGAVDGLLDIENTLAVCASLGVTGRPSAPNMYLDNSDSVVPTIGSFAAESLVSVLFDSSGSSVGLLLVWCSVPCSVVALLSSCCSVTCDTGGVAN